MDYNTELLTENTVYTISVDDNNTVYYEEF